VSSKLKQSWHGKSGACRRKCECPPDARSLPGMAGRLSGSYSHCIGQAVIWLSLLHFGLQNRNRVE
jgi:hypothetical protein